jgi:molybdenum-dependent DNA-binding transcriptional regulator ModE
MTLAQLQSFVLVARLGSVKAAAAQLGVNEAAVSVAVAALRRELGDELFVRDGRGIALTPGGRRLAALASEILGLAEQARRSVQDSPGQARLMQVAVTNVAALSRGSMCGAPRCSRCGTPRRSASGAPCRRRWRSSALPPAPRPPRRSPPAAPERPRHGPGRGRT